MSWVFMLRAASEAADLVYTNSELLLNRHTELPPAVKGISGLVGTDIVLMAAPRKN